jgi:phage virion morphogenesis protein
MITISIDDRSVLSALQALRNKVEDLSPAMNEIGMEIETRVSARFETQRDPSGQAWHPWAASTRKSYPKAGNGSILDRLGDMLGSLNHQADKDGVTIRFGKDYAIYHEFGAKKMPRRGLMMEDPNARRLSGEDEQSILSILQRHLAI